MIYYFAIGQGYRASVHSGRAVGSDKVLECLLLDLAFEAPQNIPPYVFLLNISLLKNSSLALIYFKVEKDIPTRSSQRIYGKPPEIGSIK
jgi:hypothetical protein